jgi:DNA-binding PadR family transcriptional regulator
MKSLNRIGTRPVSLPLSADDIVEFHAARLLLLLSVCGVSGRIDGLTKMAKLDFFVRYPGFFEVARAATIPAGATDAPQRKESDDAVESAMVRHHYGPWDKRYYHVLSHLEAKWLITVAKEGNSYRIALTDLGRKRAEALKARPSFAPILETMREVKKTFGAKNGTFLKKLIYRLFDAEVARRPWGKAIER